MTEPKWRGRGARNGKVVVKIHDAEGHILSTETLKRAAPPELAPGANPFVSHDLGRDYFFDAPRDEGAITKRDSRPPPAPNKVASVNIRS